MNPRRCFQVPLVTLFLLVCACPLASADVSPGDIVDKTSWKKAEKLLPESVLNWVKKGDMVLRVGRLAYDPKDYFPPAARASLEPNRGKYDLDPNNLVIDAETGKPPEFIEGIPFPDIEPKDPKAAEKIMYDRMYYTYTQGNIRLPYDAAWVSRNTGYDRDVQCAFLQYPLTGYGPARNESNKPGIERFSILQLLAPFDIAGTNVLLWRFLDQRKDNTFAYIPAIRRVRRMSPANRSDAYIGSDLCVDDAWAFDGKVTDFEWKVLRKQEGLVGFLDPAPQAFEKNESGEWHTTRGIRAVAYGHHKEGWQGAPWVPTNLVWVKRPIYVLSLTPKDPYYNYGVQEIWVDAEVPFMLIYKAINDRAGDYWKTLWMSFSGFMSADDRMRLLMVTSIVVTDDRTDHSTVVDLANPNNLQAVYAVQDRNDYSLGGFQKLCK